MKPFLEKIHPGFESSFFIKSFSPEELCHKKPQWHFHPEYEIVYIEKGNGRRHIGEHMGNYRDGELIFLGPNLPHLSYANPNLEVVVQMRPDFMGQEWLGLPEFQAIKHLFERAKGGIVFNDPFKHEAGHLLRQAASATPFERIILLLQLLQQMATTSDYIALSINRATFAVNSAEQERMEGVYNFVEDNFTRHIPLDEVAALINMTVPAFCRYFKKITKKTFTQFVNELRITYACRLLRDTEMSIAAIGFECGFNNLSHFNKQFKQHTGDSPRTYRQRLLQVVGIG